MRTPVAGPWSGTGSAASSRAREVAKLRVAVAHPVGRAFVRTLVVLTSERILLDARRGGREFLGEQRRQFPQRVRQRRGHVLKLDVTLRGARHRELHHSSTGSSVASRCAAWSFST